MTLPPDEGLHAQQNLIWICNRWTDLRARLEPMVTGDGQGVRTAPKSRPPIDLQISDLLFEIEEEARTLGLVLMDETDWTPRTSSMPGLLRDVAMRYGHWFKGDTHVALAFADWAEEYQRKVQKALEKPPSPEFIGLCPVVDCAGDVYVKRGGGLGKCRSCGQQVPVAERREEIRRLSQDWLVRQFELPAALSLHGYDVPLDTVKSWVHRKRLLPRGRLYRVSDALDLLHNTPVHAMR